MALFTSPEHYWSQGSDTLIAALRSSEDRFRTGWFFESVLTELLIVLVIRTQRSFFRSRPGRTLLIATLAIVAVTIGLPYSPLNRVLGFVPLPLPVLLILLLITALYVTTSEVTKGIFFRRVHQ
jgi:Mg2+-importing ATPase